jgi:site-specific DNA recombinase
MQMQRAAIYVRVSSPGQEEGSSLATQESSCRQHAHDAGVVVADEHVYRETFTGTELWERPELTRLRAAITRRDVDVVICHAIDRLSRDPVHQLIVITEADQHGVDVQFVTELLDTSSEGKLVRYVRGYAAKIEHEKIRERTTRGKLARVASGRMIAGCHALYGYSWRDDAKSGYVEHPEHSLIVRRIFQRYDIGHSIRQIARDLTADAILTPTGQRVWQPSTVNSMLRHQSYAGRAYAWGSHKNASWRAKFDADKAIRLPDGTIPAIVDPVIFDRVTARLATNPATGGRSLPDNAVLLRGRVYCATCGGRMYVERDRYRPVNLASDAALPDVFEYQCRQQRADGSQCRKSSIRAAGLDADAWRLIVSQISNPAILARAIERMRADDTATRDLAALDAALRQIAKERTNLMRVAALVDDDDAAALLAAQLDDLAGRQRQLAGERDVIAAQAAQATQIVAFLHTISEWGALLAAHADAVSWSDRLALVDIFDVKAIVSPKAAERRVLLQTRLSPALLNDAAALFGADAGLHKLNTTTCSHVQFPEIVLTFSVDDLALAA